MNTVCCLFFNYVCRNMLHALLDALFAHKLQRRTTRWYRITCTSQERLNESRNCFARRMHNFLHLIIFCLMLDCSFTHLFVDMARFVIPFRPTKLTERVAKNIMLKTFVHNSTTRWLSEMLSKATNNSFEFQLHLIALFISLPPAFVWRIS